MQRLDRYVGGNRSALAVVRVPAPAEEQKRAQVRLRSQLKTMRRQCEARGRSALLTQGLHITGPWWRPQRWAQLQADLPPWLAELLRPLQELAWAVDQKERALRAALEAAAPPRLPRAVGALSWVVLSREIVDWGRFKNRRQVASYTGLCPGTAQSGRSRRDGAINRCGNRVVRHVLVETVWRLMRFQPGYPPLRRLVSESLSPRQRRKCVVAAARRLAIDLWRWATGQCTSEKLGLGRLVSPA